MANPLKKRAARERRHRRVRARVVGTPERPRLSVFKSARHIYAQIIDDEAGRTLVAASTLSPEFKTRQPVGGKTEAAKVVGALVAEKALSAQVRRVVFDRGGYRFHGRVRALATAAREKGLEF